MILNIIQLMYGLEISVARVLFLHAHNKTLHEAKRSPPTAQPLKKKKSRSTWTALELMFSRK